MRRTDWHRIRHMLEAARQAVQFTVGCQRGDLDTDLKTAFAHVRCIEVIGEAATNATCNDYSRWRTAVFSGGGRESRRILAG